MALAIKAHLVDRVISIWRCRPESAVADKVQLQVANLFQSGNFANYRPFIDALLKSGWNFLVSPPPTSSVFGRGNYGWSPVYKALSNANIDGLEWLTQNAPTGYWNKYPALMNDLDTILSFHLVVCVRQNADYRGHAVHA